MTSRTEESRQERGDDPVADRYSAVHRALARIPLLLTVYRVAIASIGFAVLALGILLLPLPGPGWAVIFAGVWVLALEFPAAATARTVLIRWAGVLVAIGARLRRRRSDRAAIGPAAGE